MKRQIIFFILFFILVGFASASVGVSPASYETNFKPNTIQNFSFDFIFDSDSVSELYVSGDFEKYVTLDKKELNGSGRVIAFISFPNMSETSGTNKIFIGAKQSSKSGFGIVGDVQGVIRVNVPYPGKYAEARIANISVGAGDLANLSVTVFNKGDETFNSAVSVAIYDSDRKIGTLDLGSRNIVPFNQEVFTKQINTENYQIGKYALSVEVNYGENITRALGVMKLGAFYINISNFSSYLEDKKISKFDIEAESFYNFNIMDVYANVSIIGTNVSFVTPSDKIGSWEKIILSGFFDSTQIKTNNAKAEITLNYANKTTSKIAEFKIKRPSNFYPFILIILILVIIVLALVARLVSQKNLKNKK